MLHEFISESLYPMPFRVKRMFGTHAYYVGKRIVLAARERDKLPEDNGLWIATKVEHHTRLIQIIPSLRHLQKHNIKTWLLLPIDADDFESSVVQICDMIKSHDELIGVVPKK